MSQRIAFETAHLVDIKHVYNFRNYCDVPWCFINNFANEINNLTNEQMFELFKTIRVDPFIHVYAQDIVDFLIHTRTSFLIDMQKAGYNIFADVLIIKIMKHDENKIVDSIIKENLISMLSYLFTTYAYPYVLSNPDTRMFETPMFYISYKTDLRIVDMLSDLQKISTNPFFNMSYVLCSICQCNVDYDTDQTFAFIKYLIEEKGASVTATTIANFALRNAEHIFQYLLSKIEDIESVKCYASNKNYGVMLELAKQGGKCICI